MTSLPYPRPLHHHHQQQQQQHQQPSVSSIHNHSPESPPLTFDISLPFDPNPHHQQPAIHLQDRTRQLPHPSLYQTPISQPQDPLAIPPSLRIQQHQPHGQQQPVHNQDQIPPPPPPPSALPHDSHSTTSTQTCLSLRKCFAKTKWYLRTSSSPAVSMVSLFVLATIFSLAHHVLYLSLDGKPAPRTRAQQRPMQGGTALALLARAAFTACIAGAQTQWVWWTVSREVVSVRAVDAMFDAPGDLTSFGTGEMWKRGKVATALAVLVWLQPIAIIFTPAALMIEPSSSTSSTTTTSQQQQLHYTYDPLPLYTSYGISILLSLAALILGIYAAHKSHLPPSLTSHGRFSAILQATRNPELDRVAWDRLRGEEVAEVRLRFKREEDGVGVGVGVGGATPAAAARGPEGDGMPGMGRGVGRGRRPTFGLGDAMLLGGNAGGLPLRAVVRYG